MTFRIGTVPGPLPRGADLFVPPEGAAWVVSDEDEETYYSDPNDGALYYSEGE
ncbi:hypothetical protein ACO2Q0_02535 [Phenylobacterium sp. VNQ135]|uniref:hypothetical protein n=1 Tax=Phenylobacterium sp. VNQ135 TaxID=3400922 RepID=UPI003C05327B